MDVIQKRDAVIQQLKAKGLGDDKINEVLSKNNLPLIGEEVKQEEPETLELDLGEPEEVVEVQEDNPEEPIEEGKSDEEVEEMDKNTDTVTSLDRLKHVLSLLKSNEEINKIDTFIPNEDIDYLVIDVLHKNGYTTFDFQNCEGENGVVIRKKELLSGNVDKVLMEMMDIAEQFLQS